MAKKTVYMIRHSLTPGNEEKRYIGKRSDESLSEKGKTEAYLMHEKLKDLIKTKPDRIVTSPMKRAVQTAEILFEDDNTSGTYVKNLNTQTIDKLSEIDFGMFEGKNHEELSGNEIYQKWIDSNGTIEIPEGEGKDAFISRSFEGFIEALGDKDKAETIAIVCHGGNIMSVLSRLTGKGYYDFMTGTLGGYCLELETDDEGIHITAYHKLGNRDNTGSDNR